MNAYNTKRLEKVLDQLDELEEEIVSCYTEEGQCLPINMSFEEKEALDDRVIKLEEALFFLMSLRDYLKEVYESVNKENDNDKKNTDSDSSFHKPVVAKKLRRYN